ncbi:hypothetical protein QWY77_01595 [Thalassotalea ponticola]|uniref:hypothetical protein n=1 Tax=Thalassotalea ponticola TaxID=1523392 RepID=UPI0025B55F24|nr:hypothetical protein [Thalassotalea ponticola]MDN3651477.1 hypothetical protein [Thalassotalea ponticola]
MKYQCCLCDFIFEGSQIKDNYKNGVKVGFLCPNCKGNIKDDLGGQTKFDKKAKGTFRLYAFIILVIFFDAEVEQYISNPLGINKWVFVGLLVMFAVSIYAISNKKLLKDVNTYTTKRVRHNRDSM